MVLKYQPLEPREAMLMLNVPFLVEFFKDWSSLNFLAWNCLYAVVFFFILDRDVVALKPKLL